MHFAVVRTNARPKLQAPGVVLEKDDWDDSTYRTLFRATYTADGTNFTPVGFVKIAHVGLSDGGDTQIPDRFEELTHEFFSLGQDVSYYQALKDLDSDVREATLRALRDVAFDLKAFHRLKNHPAMQKSLLRTQVETTVTGQYHRIANGGRTLIDQHFEYSATNGLRLDFAVKPDSEPPTNVHALIGSNGTGKTQLLNDITRAAIRPGDNLNNGVLLDRLEGRTARFANVMSISFSAFDTLRAVEATAGIKYDHVALDRTHRTDGRTPARQFDDVVRSLVGERRVRWRNALATLGQTRSCARRSKHLPQKVPISCLTSMSGLYSMD